MSFVEVSLTSLPRSSSSCRLSVFPTHLHDARDHDAFADRHAIPIVPFESGQRKDDIVADYRARFTRREGVVVLGTAQEKMRAFKAHKRRTATGSVTFDFSRQAV